MKTNSEIQENPKGRSSGSVKRDSENVQTGNLLSKEEDYSAIDPSLVNDLLRSEESGDAGRVRFVNQRQFQYEGTDENNDQMEEDQLGGEYQKEDEDNEGGGEDYNYKYNSNEHEEEEVDQNNNNNRFTGEIVNINEESFNNDKENNQEEEELEDPVQNLQIHQQQPNNKRKEKAYQHGMERISEVEGEDEKYNTMFDKINEEVLKEDYQINEKNIDDLLRTNVNSKNMKELFNPVLYNNEQEQSYTFKPQINKKSQILISESDGRNKSPDVSSRRDGPIELELYKDATKRQEKLEKIEKNHLMGILLNASKTKISNNSHRIAINKIEKVIESAVAKREKDKTKRLTFIDVGRILTDLKIFREIFPSDEEGMSNKEKKKFQNYKDIKLELSNIKEQEKRKRSEVDFYEQLWITLNPENKESVRSDIVCEFFKILFSPVASSVQEISSILHQFLIAAFFLNSNPEDQKKYISPLTEKQINPDEVWKLDKLVREFLFLKENILAYQGIKNISKKLAEDIEKDNKVKFHPNQKESYKSRSNFFEERLPALLDRDKLRRQVLEEMKKESEQSVINMFLLFFRS